MAIKIEGSKQWIKFTVIPWAGKTQRWKVETLLGVTLGHVKWWGAWRQYVYEAEAGTIYEPNCGRAIFYFCEQQTKAYRGKMPRLTRLEKCEST